MAKYTCPSCGAAFNGKKCRQCYYEHFTEEITHGLHTHEGEPLVIDAPVRKPVKRKNPFEWENRRKKKKHPIAGFLAILLIFNSLLPLIRDWGLELEAREAAMTPEPLPEDLVILYEEGAVTIYLPSWQLTEFADSGLTLWVENESKDFDVYVMPKYILANGFAMNYASFYAEAQSSSIGKGFLYLDEEELADAHITDLQELSFVLEVVDEDYTVLFETHPIILSKTGRPLEQETDLGGTLLIEDGGIRMSCLGYAYDREDPKFENGQLKFYIENDTDNSLCMNSLEMTIGGDPVDLYLWTNLPAHSRTVVGMDLYALEELDWDTPSELEELAMTVEFWDPENYSASIVEYAVTVPLTDGGTR